MAVNQARYSRYRRYFTDLGQFYQKKKVRVYTGIVLSLLTVTFFLFFAIRPTAITIASLSKEIKDQKDVVEKLQDKINALNTAQVEYQKVEKELGLIEETLPIDPTISLLIRQLEALTRQYGTIIVSLRLDQTPLGGQALTQEGKSAGAGASFSLAVSADYPTLKTFLDSLVNFRRLISVEGFSFQADQEGTLVLNLNAQAHYLPKEEGVAE